MDSTLLLLSSLLAALAAFCAGWVVTGLQRPPAADPTRLTFEEARRKTLAEGNVIWGSGGVLCDEMASLAEVFYSPKDMETLDHALATSGQKLPWTAKEFLTVKFLEGLAAGAVVGSILSMAIPLPFVVGFALFVAGVYAWSSASGAVSRSRSRLQRLKSRFAHAIDLMAMMQQAGGSTREALETVTRENRGHPLGEELGLVLSRVEHGQTFSEALLTLRDRCRDPDVNDFVFAVVQGVELGSPLTQVLSSQADQLRLKHSQWCEKLAAEAGVKSTFPNMLVMFGCIIVILGPLLLPVVFQSLDW